MAGHYQNRGGRNNRDSERWEFTSDHQAELKKWISEQFETNTINYADKFGKYLYQNRLTSSQMRIIYGEVKRIEANILAINDTQSAEQQGESLKRSKKDFLLLRPKIAYAAKRSGSRGIEDLQKVMEVAHGAVELDEGRARFKETMENFADFFEAILAYHKAYGGRD